MRHSRSLFIPFLLLLFIGCKKKHNDPPPPPPPPPPPVLSSDKLITSFTFRTGDNTTVLFADVIGSIGSDTITAILEKDMNISSLIPTITISGLRVTPNSNTAQNFNNTINYIVTAADGSTKKYTVKIVLVTGNQKVYIGSDDGNLYALNARNGSLLWQYTTGGPIKSTPCLANNTIYVGSNDKFLYAIDATTGALKWKYLTPAPIWSESPVAANGIVYINSSTGYPDGNIYAIDAVSGTLKWSKFIPVPTSPVAWAGKVFVGGIEGDFYALNELNGNVIWSKSVGINRTNPAISDGKLYINAANAPSGITCLDASNGNFLWQIPCSSSGTGPTINNGTIFVSSSASTQQFSEAYNAANGGFKWRYSPIYAGTSPSPTPSYPVVSGNIVFPGFHYGVFYALNAMNGTVAWEFGDGTQIGWCANPATANGVVYVSRQDRYLYALDAATGNMKWKFLTYGTVYAGPCGIDADGVTFHAGSSGATN
jgi:eukaryotic-like serine/threonine-protein kinase